MNSLRRCRWRLTLALLLLLGWWVARSVVSRNWQIFAVSPRSGGRRGIHLRPLRFDHNRIEQHHRSERRRNVTCPPPAVVVVISNVPDGIRQRSPSVEMGRANKRAAAGCRRGADSDSHASGASCLRVSKPYAHLRRVYKPSSPIQHAHETHTLTKLFSLSPNTLR